MKAGVIVLSCAVAVVALTGFATWAAPAAREEVLPLIQMENVLLTDAIRQMARKARLNILFDPRLSGAPYDRLTVSMRWENVTAREALTALLDNYGLVMVESPSRVKL